MLEDGIKDIIKKYKGFFGVYICTDNGIEIKLNTETVFKSASLIKLFILLSIDERNLKEKIKVREEDIVGGGGVLDKLHSGLELTVKDLAVLMITLSDNMATNILIDYLGMDRINRNILKNGFKKTVLQRKMLDIKVAEQGMDNYTTAEEIMKVLKILYEKPIFLNMLLEQQINFKLSLYLSENTDFKFAHKTGELVNIEHDAGRLYYKDRYIDVVVMTKNLPDNSEGIKLQNEIGEYLKKVIAQ